MKKQKAKGREQKTGAARLCLWLAAFCLFAFPALADFELKRWKQWREIIFSDNTSSEFVRVELDGKVFDAAQPDLNDLRVVDEQNAEAASKVIMVAPELVEKAKPVSIPVTISDQVKSRTLKRGPRVEQATEFTIDLGYRHTPSVRIEFDPASTNFRRRVNLQGSNDQQDWREVEDTEIFNIRIGRARQQRLSVDYGEVKYRYLVVTIFNYDDQPLRMKEVRVYGWPRQLLFRREPGRTYRLFYGNAQASAPRYDLEQLSAYLKPEQLPLAALGAERGNERFLAESNQPQKSDRHPAWLWVTMGAAALALGALIYRLARMTAGGEAKEG
jgi:hypothetical protein